jgi:hypothetical protein
MDPFLILVVTLLVKILVSLIQILIRVLTRLVSNPVYTSTIPGPISTHDPPLKKHENNLPGGQDNAEERKKLKRKAPLTEDEEEGEESEESDRENKVVQPPEMTNEEWNRLVKEAQSRDAESQAGDDEASSQSSSEQDTDEDQEQVSNDETN